MPGPGRPPKTDGQVRKELKNARYQLNVLRRALSSWKAAALAWRELAEDAVKDTEGTDDEQNARREYERGEQDASAARGQEEAAARAVAEAAEQHGGRPGDLPASRGDEGPDQR